MVNGGHIDSTDPQTISRWLEFLDIYVAGKVPTEPDSLAALVLDEFAGFASGVSSQAPLPAIRFTQRPDVATAQAEFAAQTPLVRVLFDNGAGAVGPGDIESTYSADFSSLATGGHGHDALLRQQRFARRAAPAASRAPRSRWTPRRGPLTSLPAGGNAWAADPDWDWTPVPAADGVAFQTAPFTTATTIVGPATLDLWVKAAVPVEDFQATITEVRPSAGEEEYITSGFLRSSNQVDSPDSTALFTDPTYRPTTPGTCRRRSYSLGEDPDRPDRPHLPARHRAARGDLRPRR